MAAQLKPKPERVEQIQLSLPASMIPTYKEIRKEIKERGLDWNTYIASEMGELFARVRRQLDISTNGKAETL